MIRIEYTEEQREVEPGPNFYWMGDQYTYASIIPILHPLACECNQEIVITDLPQVTEINGFRIVGRSIEDSWYLVRKRDNEIAIEVHRGLWRKILVSFLKVSYQRCHDYLDFDDDELFADRIQEDANLIVSSEW